MPQIGFGSWRYSVFSRALTQEANLPHKIFLAHCQYYPIALYLSLPRRGAALQKVFRGFLPYEECRRKVPPKLCFRRKGIEVGLTGLKPRGCHGGKRSAQAALGSGCGGLLGNDKQSLFILFLLRSTGRSPALHA